MTLEDGRNAGITPMENTLNKIHWLSEPAKAGVFQLSGELRRRLERVRGRPQGPVVASGEGLGADPRKEQTFLRRARPRVQGGDASHGRSSRALARPAQTLLDAHRRAGRLEIGLAGHA